VFRFFAILLLIFAVLTLTARLLRRITASIFSPPPGKGRQTGQDTKNEILYNKNDIIVMKGDAESNNKEDI